ncbi:MAG TPA: expansin EXLX1 family cellulose-binding protein [Streptosporangiaceae bacterium]|nr:expansin EXLX1 family cellulose-binding protein [Streptosporangiaceae bacterium]
MRLLRTARGRPGPPGQREASLRDAPRRPRQGNRIWLATSVITVTVLTGGALRLSAGACAATQSPAAATAAAMRLPAAAVAPAPGVTAINPPGVAGIRAPAIAGTRPPVAQPGSPATAVAGHAVFYDPGAATGSCSLGPFPATGWYASLPPRAYASGVACGSYLEVRGPSGTVRAEVVDSCADCRTETIDLSRAAFERIADPRSGTVAVSYWPAADPPLRGPLVLRVSTAAGPRSLAIQVINHGNRLTSVEVAAGSGNRWQRLAADPDGYWTGLSGTGQAGAGRAGGRRIRVRITDVMGHQVVVSGVKLGTGTVRSTIWMYQRGSHPSTAAATRAAGTPRHAARATPAGGGC